MHGRHWPLALGLLSVMALAVGLWPGGDAPPRSAAVGPDEGPPQIEIVVPKPPKEKYVSKGQACASGCSMKKHPVPPFTAAQFRATLTAFAAQPLPAAGAPSSLEIDRLLFYGKRTRELLTELDRGRLGKVATLPKLPKAHRRWLDGQLAHSHAEVALRIVDDRGRVRANLPWTRVPFGDKQHLRPKTVDIQPMEFNGTVMRTGMGHIWARY
jgi:hypothetical protein